MARAGFCRACGQNVFLSDEWGCANGHDWSQDEGWYATETGQPITPHRVDQPAGAPLGDPAVTPPAADSVESEAAAPPAPPVDPVEQMRETIRSRLAGINMAISDEDGALAVSRGSEYEALVSVRESGEIVLWEYLSAGMDPGVRENVRAVASEGGWRFRVALWRGDAVAG